MVLCIYKGIDMTKEKTEFEQFCDDIEKFTAQIEQKRSLRSKKPSGSLIKRILLRLRDGSLLFKISWTQAETWIALPKAIVFFLALTPIAIHSFNSAMSFLHIPFGISLEQGAFITIILVSIVALFGIIAHRNLGLRKGQNALGVKQNAGWFMAWKMWNEVKKLKKELKELRKDRDEQ